MSEIMPYDYFREEKLRQAHKIFPPETPEGQAPEPVVRQILALKSRETLRSGHYHIGNRRGTKWETHYELERRRKLEEYAAELRARGEIR